MKDAFRNKLFVEKDALAEAEYIKGRRVKAQKIRAVLRDLGIDSGEMLDIGCSIGIISDFFKNDFKVTGIDVDSESVEYAVQKWDGAEFIVASGEKTGLEDNRFDVVICTGIYEHVSDPFGLLREIKRVLKPSGVCYFTGMNRLIPIEPHYKLPFLSYFPRCISDLYLGIIKQKKYDVNAFSLFGLKKLTSDFEIIDYTKKIILDPEKYNASDMIDPGSIGHCIARFIVKYIYVLVPTYVWILKKKNIG